MASEKNVKLSLCLSLVPLKYGRMKVKIGTKQNVSGKGQLAPGFLGDDDKTSGFHCNEE
jgi:hypothetical protein